MSSPATVFTVSTRSANQRLDIFLSKKLKISRSQAQKMIKENLVMVNNKLPKKAGDKIKDGNVVKFTEPIKLVKFTKLPDPIKPVKSEPKLNIIAETDDYLIVNKPSGLLTHPVSQAFQALSNILIKKYPEIKKVGDQPNIRPGIIHRLDKEASGLLVVARTQKMFNHLKQQFKNRTIDKEYLVLVHGKVNKDWDEINFPIKRTRNKDRMASVPRLKQGLITDEGKEAKTEFIVEKRFADLTLLRVKIHTGRMHQIRTHLLAYNHPVVGDPLYFQKKQKRKWDEKCGRLFLHCCKLGFVDLENNKKEFKKTPPNELNNFLKQIK